MVMPSSLANSSDGEALGWASTAGGFEDETLAGQVITVDGSIIIAGSFTSAMSFGEEGIGATGFSGDVDMYVARMNSDGEWNSHTNFGSDGDDGIDAIALHPSGDIILAGHFCLGTAMDDCSVFFSSTLEVSKGAADEEGDAFVGRFSFVGDTLEPVWVRTISNPNDLSALDISIGQNGAISVGIFHRGTIELGSMIVPGSQGVSLALITYDENGVVIWANGISSPVGIEPFGALCHSSDGYLHVVGTFVESVMFIDMTESNGGSDIFAAQVDGDGNFTWTIFAGGTGDDWVSDCAVGNDGEVRMVGQFERTATFGFTNVTSNGWWDMFHARAYSNGAWGDITSAGGGGWESLVSIALDQQDNAFVTGTYASPFTLGIDQLADFDNNGDRRDVFVALLDSDDEWMWANSGGGNGDDISTAIALDPDGSPIIGMEYSNTISLGNHSMNAQGGVDVGFWLYAQDHDSDGLLDGLDNCPRVPNPNQDDHDNDQQGDACDDDDDNDGVADEWDGCSPGEILWLSSSPTDHDGDGCRDATEDLDDDNDGIYDYNDSCPEGPVGWISTLENDEDQNGCEDVDSDGDGYVDQLDTCPNVPDDQADLDGDGIGDACETDTDGDGISDEFDACPRDNFDWLSEHDNDHDQDGCRDDDRDADDDGDGVLDLSDRCPVGQINWDPSEDHDGDGCRDADEDNDDDDDSYLDSEDNCPKGLVGISGQGMDLDRDGCIDGGEDDDDDNDGVLDLDDECSYTPSGLEVDELGCSGVQLDDDGDGVHNLDDLCPSTTPGVPISSTGCEIQQSGNDAEGSDEEDSTSWFVYLLFAVAAVLVVAALYVAFKPEDEQPEAKKVPTVSGVDNGGGQGHSSAASTDVDNSSLDNQGIEPELSADES